MRFGTWNVRSLYRSGSLTTAVRELARHKLDLVGIQEVRCRPGSSVGIVTDYGLDGPGIESRWGARFSACPDWPWGPPSLLYNGYRVFPRGKVWLGHATDHSLPSSTEVLEE